MLVAMDRHRALLDKASAYAVCAFAFFAPACTGQYPPGTKCRVVARRAASLDGDAVPIGKQHAASNTPDREIKSVQTRLGNLDERLNFLPGLPTFGISQPFRWLPLGRIEPMQTG